MSFANKRAVTPLFYLFVGLFFGYLLYHSLAGDTFLVANPYDSYALQAENWLAGHNYIINGENYPWLELAIYQDKYYLSFPIVPSVILLPWVMLFGGAGAVPSNLVIALFACATIVAVYLLFLRRGASVQTAVFWALLSCVGSNFFWLGCSGGVWFMAQVLNLFFLAWGLYFASAKTLTGNIFAALFLALAVGCRPFSICVLALFFWLVWLPIVRKEYNPLRWGAVFWVPFFVACAVGACLAWYNWVRFGNPMEFGHNYLPEFVRAEDGQFHLSYLLENLENIFSPITLNEAWGLEFRVFNGFFLFAANPIFVVWLIGLGKRIFTRKLCMTEILASLALCGVVVLYCCHKTMGGWQFGVRYMVDVIPYVWLCALCAVEERKQSNTPQATPMGWEWFLCSLAMAFNVYGALYMLQV